MAARGKREAQVAQRRNADRKAPQPRWHEPARRGQNQHKRKAFINDAPRSAVCVLEQRKNIFQLCT
jgi:hypothetical protein